MKVADESNAQEPAPDARPQRLPAGRHGLSREFVARNQQERILDAMGKSVAEHGFAAASLSDVIARAGVSRKTFYEHFTDKEDCFLQAYDAVAAGLRNRVASAYSQGEAAAGGRPRCAAASPGFWR